MPPDKGHPVDSNLRDGTLLGPYRILSLLGQGSVGKVYKVEHTVLKRKFALKVLRPEFLSSPDAVQRFKQEAGSTAQLQHPSILPADEFGESEGLIWLRMPLVSGRIEANTHCLTLQDAMDAGKEFDPDEVQNLLKHLLGALEYAHKMGLVHRDIKPANILLSGKDGAVLSDFGILSFFQKTFLQEKLESTQVDKPIDYDHDDTVVDGQPDATASSTISGTPAYMSAEQRAGNPPDPRDDLYALGLIAFQLLTGQRNPGASSPSELKDGLDPVWDGWIKMALHPDQAQRFRSAGDMQIALPTKFVSRSKWVLASTITFASIIVIVYLLFAVLPEPEIASGPDPDVASAQVIAEPQAVAIEPLPVEPDEQIVRDEPASAWTDSRQDLVQQVTMKTESAEPANTVDVLPQFAGIPDEFGLSMSTLDGRIRYREGEMFTFVIRAQKACYITVLSRQPDGEIKILFPNRYQPDCHIPAGRAVLIPDPSKATFDLVVRPPFGKDSIQVIACTEFFELNQLIEQNLGKMNTEEVFASIGQDSLNNTLVRGLAVEKASSRPSGTSVAKQWAKSILTIETHQ